MASDAIPSLNPGGADERVRQAKGSVVVILAQNEILNGAEAEDIAFVRANAGVDARVVAHRPVRSREETLRGFRSAWDGNMAGWTSGAPWWWRANTTGGRAPLEAERAAFDSYLRAHAAGEATRSA